MLLVLVSQPYSCTITVLYYMYCRSHLLHYVVIVAAEDIPKMTELTYDYGRHYVQVCAYGTLSAVLMQH